MPCTRATASPIIIPLDAPKIPNPIAASPIINAVLTIPSNARFHPSQRYLFPACKAPLFTDTITHNAPAAKVSKTPRLLGKLSALATSPCNSHIATMNTARNTKQINSILTNHGLIRQRSPEVFQCTTRCTTPTINADPGIERMKNSPSSWVSAPYSLGTSNLATITVLPTLARAIAIPAMTIGVAANMPRLLDCVSRLSFRVSSLPFPIMALFLMAESLYPLYA
jgi:hypothetical protein